MARQDGKCDMDVQIRLEQLSDYRETENVVREAFWNRYSPGCMEHYLLHVMRGSSNFVHELNYVAVSVEKVIGAVAFQKAFIVSDDGTRHEVLSMGPVAVLPAFQGKGVGRMLINYACEAAAAIGYRAILLCGDPVYYTRIGFMPAERFGIRTSENKYFAALHVRPLRENALQGLCGRYYEDDIYSVDQSAAADFDKQFPPKELLSGTPSQRRFKEICSLQRDYEI